MKSNILTNESDYSARRSAESIVSYVTGAATRMSGLSIASEYRFPCAGVLKLRLVIVTRARILKSQWSHFASNHLLDPDYLISFDTSWNAPLTVLARPGVHSHSAILPPFCMSSGAQHIDGGIQINSYYSFLFPERYMVGQWLRNADLPAINVQQLVEGGLGLSLQFLQGAVARDRNFRTKLERRLFEIYGVFAEVTHISGDTVTIRFPTSKGALLRVLAQALSLSEATVIAGGDRMDDLDMISPPANQGYVVQTGIVVANAQANLLEAARSQPAERIYISTLGCLLGVLQGMMKGLQLLVTNQQTSQV